MRVDLKQNEMVVKAGNSNRFWEDGLIEGKFIVTNQRIYFKAFNGHEGKFDLEVTPEQLREVHFFNTGFFSRDGLNLILKSGEQHRFRVKKRNDFGELINKMY